ncbi:MAG: hypothetical protein ACE361_02155 [Aureliella sp.]
MSRVTYLLLGSVLAGTFCTGCAVTPNEQCNDDRVHVQNFWYDYYRNKAWPMPFRAQDTSAVLSYFEVQRNNGWKLNNTLGASMFDPASCSLNDSGRAHVKWIVKRSPKDRRVVFVLEGADAEETAKRIESTQIAISQILPTGELPAIYLTDQDAPGSGGAYQTAVSRAIINSAPAPRLPPSPASTGSSSGGSQPSP